MYNQNFFSKEQIRLANEASLIQLAKSHDYLLENSSQRAYHGKSSGGLYSFRKSNKYYHFSTDTNGGPIYFATQFLSMASCCFSFRSRTTLLLSIIRSSKRRYAHPSRKST